MSSDSMRTARLLPSRFPIGSRPPRWLLAESVEHMAVIWVFLCPLRQFEAASWRCSRGGVSLPSSIAPGGSCGGWREEVVREATGTLTPGSRRTTISRVAGRLA
jgi:hypothetical protein